MKTYDTPQPQRVNYIRIRVLFFNVICLFSIIELHEENTICETVLSSADSLVKLLQCAGLNQDGAKSYKAYKVSHVGGQEQGTWSILYCTLRHPVECWAETN